MHPILIAALAAAPLPTGGVHYVLNAPDAVTTDFGTEVVDLADLDGDGIRDLALGLPDAGPGPDHGRILIVSGRDGTTLRTIDGDAGTGTIGRSLGNVGDVDGDGFEDVGTVVIPPGLRSVVVFSAATGAVLWIVPVAPTLRPRLVGIGDVNGDGKGEVLYGDPQRNYGSTGIALLGPGEVRLLSGADGSPLRVVTGTYLGAGLGAVIGAPGDVDGDSVPDYALTGGGPGGALRILSGATGQRLRPLALLSFRAQVVRVGDLDGDGQGDLVVGELNGARAISTGTWSELWSVRREFSQYSGLIDTSVAGAGDVDGDGVEDVLVGFDDPSRSAHLPGLVHQGPGRAVVVSGSDGSQIASFTGTAMDQGYGSRVGALGDVDGDGVLDIWVASPRAKVNGVEVGAIEVRSALDVLSGPTSYCVAGLNAAGTVARLSTTGTTSVANNDLVFTVTGGVPGETAVLLYGREVSARIYGGGTLCIADRVLRVRAGSFDVQGGFTVALDLNALPSQGPIVPGSTWSFQVGYRTPFNPTMNGTLVPGINASDALRVPFAP